MIKLNFSLFKVRLDYVKVSLAQIDLGIWRHSRLKIKMKIWKTYVHTKFISFVLKCILQYQGL